MTDEEAPMKCQDIPDRPVLEFLEGLDGQWANWFADDDKSVRTAMPADIPDKLVLAKMKQLIKRGAVMGCGCGCRGDFVITDKGREMIVNLS